MMYSKTLVAQTVKNLPTMQGTQVRSMGREDALEKGMATHSSILVCATPWSVAHQATLQEVAKSQIQLSTHTHTLQIMWPTLDMYSSHIPFKFLEESRHYKKNYSTFCIDSFSCFSLGYSKSCEQTLCNYVLPAKGVALTRWT